MSEHVEFAEHEAKFWENRYRVQHKTVHKLEDALADERQHRERLEEELAVLADAADDLLEEDEPTDLKPNSNYHLLRRRLWGRIDDARTALSENGNGGNFPVTGRSTTSRKEPASREERRTMAETITPENAEGYGEFGSYRKTAVSRISTFTVPPGTPFETPEGLKAEDEETRIAFDAQGGVYPIRESVFQATYERDEDA